MLWSKALRPGLALAALWTLLRWLLHGAFVVGLIALVAALSAAAAPRLLGHPTFSVSGGSMASAVPNGSLIVARWTAAKDIQRGDVIIFREDMDSGPASAKIHRVVWLGQENGRLVAQTKGDANRTPDPNVYVLPDRVLASAYTVPYAGFVMGFVATPLGWALTIALPATLLCVVTIWRIWAGEGRRAATPRTV